MILRAVAVIVAIGSLSLTAAAQSPRTDQAAAPFESRADYVFPFATRAEWLTFIGKGSGGAVAVSTYDRLFPEADWVRYRDGGATRASRITYRSDGLLIRGLIVEPRTPGPHPVVVFNHGGVMQWGRIILPEVLEFHRLAERGHIVVASIYRGEGGS